MNSDDFVEKSDDFVYNIGNRDENKDATNVAPYTGKVVERINKADMKPLNNPSCVHTKVQRDPSEELGFAYSCPDCGLGWIFDNPIEV